MKRESLIIVASLLCALFPVIQIHRVASLPADSMWTSPESLNVRVPRFKVTVWLNVTTPTNSWQFYLIYNKTEVSVIELEYTGMGKSQWSEALPTDKPPTDYGSHNATHDYVMAGEVLKNSAEKTGAGTLCRIEFQILEDPVGNKSITGEIRLDIPGMFSTSVMDKEFNYILIDFGKTTYVFEPSVAPPEVELLSPQNLTYTSASIPLTFTVNESVSWIGYSINEGSNVTVYGNLTVILAPGYYSLIVYANSTAGNMGCSDRIFFTVEYQLSSSWTMEDGIRLEGGWTGNSIVVKLDNETYRMYAGDCLLEYYPLGGVFRSAISTDLLTWTWESGIRIGYGNGGEDGCVGNGDVVVLPNGTYRMYYSHPYYDAGIGDYASEILSAVSTDGLTWEKEPGIRIDHGGAYDTFRLEFPDVTVLEDGTYRMYYDGSDGYHFRILSAVSSDGVAWTKEPGVRIDVGGAYDGWSAMSSVTIRAADGRYVMLYCGQSGDWTARILSAISDDGLNWTKEDGIRLGQGDYAFIYPSALVKLSGDQYRLYLTADRYPVWTNRTIALSAIGTIASHNLAVSKLAHSKTGCSPRPTISPGSNLIIDFEVMNAGGYDENVNASIYVNNTKISEIPLSLDCGENVSTSLNWNTTGFAEYQNINVTVVLSGVGFDVSYLDNSVSSDIILVTHMGDVTGDGKVDIADVSRVSGAYGSLRVSDSSDPQYGKYRHPVSCVTCPHEPNTDITGDGKVDIADLARTSGNFGWHR